MQKILQTEQSTPPNLSCSCLHPANCNILPLSIPLKMLNVCGRVQAWPVPLTGAGLIQNHQVAADETVRRVGELAREDG